MSLIELLVATAVGAFLMVLLNSVLGSVQTGWHRAETAASASDEELAGGRFILASLAAALPPDPLDQATWFHGTSDRIEFLAVPPAADAFRGPVKIRLYSKSQENGGKVLVAEMDALHQPAAAVSTGSATSYVIGGLESVSFGYTDLHVGQLQETASWSDAARLPKLIRVTISYMDKNIKPLQLSMMPRRTVSGRCNFDSISLSCRI